MLYREEAGDLLAYDAWACERMTRVLERAGTPSAKIRRIWAHVAAASELWFARTTGAHYELVVIWPDTEVQESSRRLAVVNERWAETAKSWTDDDLRRRVSFANSRGEPCSDALGDIVRHLANHGTHHRAQIAMLLRENGTQPENLDFIIYCREQARAAPPRS